MIRIDPTLNPLEVLIVTEDLQRRGIERYSLRPGNDCIWAEHGPVNEYYIFREGRLVDTIVD